MRVYKPDHVSTIYTESSRTAEAAIDKLDPTMKIASLNYTFLNNNFNLSIQVLINEKDDVFEQIIINNTYDTTKYNFTPENLVSDEILGMRKLAPIISQKQPELYLFEVINERILYTPSGPRNPVSIHMQLFIKTGSTIEITPHFFGYRINGKKKSATLEIFTYEEVHNYLHLLSSNISDSTVAVGLDRTYIKPTPNLRGKEELDKQNQEGTKSQKIVLGKPN